MELRELDKQISSKKPSQLYFFYGDEQFLLEHKVNSIKNLLIDNDFEEFNFVRLDGKKVTAQEIENSVLSVPVMSDKKLVVVSNCGIFGNAKSKDFSSVCELISDLPEYLTLIFTEREFDKKKEKNLDIFKKHGAIVKFEQMSPKQLELWIEQILEKNGKTALASDISKIVALCGQSMATIHSELSKLLNFVGERNKITSEDISSVVSKTIDARIFDIIDNIALGKTKSVFEEINTLRFSGENPSTILSLISTRMSDLLLVRQLLEDKLSSDRIGEYFEPRRHPFVIKKLTEQCRRFNLPYLKKMTLKGTEYAASVRSGLLDKWVAVEMYVAELLKK